MYYVSAKGVDERTINVHYYYYTSVSCAWQHSSGSQLNGQYENMRVDVLHK